MHLSGARVSLDCVSSDAQVRKDLNFGDVCVGTRCEKADSSRRPSQRDGAFLGRRRRFGRLIVDLRLRGPNGAKDEFLLAATAQNLRKMAKLLQTAAPAMAN